MITRNTCQDGVPDGDHDHQGADVVGGGDGARLGGLQAEPPLDRGDHHVDEAVDADTCDMDRVGPSLLPQLPQCSPCTVAARERKTRNHFGLRK